MVGSPFPTGGNGSGLFSASNTATVTIRKKFLYVANTGSNNISGFSINTTTGALTPVPDSPFATGGSGSFFGISLAVTPNGKFVYAGNAGSGNISAFRVGSNGALTPILGSPFFVGDAPDGIKVSPNGKFLYASNRGPDSIAIFRIDSKKGTLAAVERAPTQGKTPRNFAIDPTGRYLFAANQDEGGITLFKIDSKTGNLTPTGDKLDVPFPVCIKFMPAGA